MLIEEETFKPQFADLIKYMTSGPSCVLALSKQADDVINEWRNDNDSLRTQYATDKIINGIHGSDSHESAMKYKLKTISKYKYLKK